MSARGGAPAVAGCGSIRSVFPEPDPVLSEVSHAPLLPLRCVHVRSGPAAGRGPFPHCCRTRRTRRRRCVCRCHRARRPRAARPELPPGRAVPRRPGDRGGRGGRRAGDVLHGVDRRRGVEEHRLRRDVEQRLGHGTARPGRGVGAADGLRGRRRAAAARRCRQGRRANGGRAGRRGARRRRGAQGAEGAPRRRRLRHRLGGRHRGGAVRPQRGVGRHGLGLHPRQRLGRRRRLPLHRCRPHLAPRRPSRGRADRRHRRPSARPGHRLGRRSRPRLRRQPGARRLPHPRRRPELAERALRERPGRRRRPRPRPVQPARPLRRHLAGGEEALGHDLRRPGQRPLQAAPTAATPGSSSPRVCRRGSRGRSAIAVSPARPGRLWVLVEHADKPGLYRSDDGGDRFRLVSADSQPHPAPLVLHARLRRPAGRRDGVRAERRHVALHRRRQELQPAAHAARRQPRPVDRSRTTRG